MSSLFKAFDVLDGRLFYIHDEPATIDEIERKARYINDFVLIVIDHIWMIKDLSGGEQI